jgi:hypothetical protein
MTPTEAADLAVRIAQTFTGPNARTWEEELLELDPGPAGTAFVRLRREHDGRLSIKQFHDTYRSLVSTDASNRPDPCPTCQDSGWCPGPRYAAFGQPYTSAQPCRCAAGRRAAESPTWRNAPDREWLTDLQADTLIRALKETP